MPYRRVQVLLCLLVAWAPAAATAQPAIVSGTVTNAATGAALTGGAVMLCPPAPGECLAAAVDGAGNYAPSVPAAAYVAFTTGFRLQGFVNELHGDIECAAECSPEAALAAGSPVELGGGSTRGGLDFALSPGGTITGVAVDAFTGDPIADADISVISTVPGEVAFWPAVTDTAGVYTVGGLAAGSYAVYLDPSVAGHEGQLYPDVPCLAGCADVAWTEGQHLDLARGQALSGINFTPAQGGGVAGTVVSAATLAPLANVRVDLHARVGDDLKHARTTFTDDTGRYRVTGLTTGTYFLTTVTDLAINEVYAGHRCLGQCALADIARGTPLDVTPGAVAADRAFELLAGATVAGVVTDAATGSPLHATVTLFTMDGAAPRVAGRTLSNGAGVYAIRGLPEGQAYAAVVSSPGYAAEIHTGAHCTDYTHEPLGGAPIRVEPGQDAVELHVALDRAAAVTAAARTRAARGGR